MNRILFLTAASLLINTPAYSQSWSQYKWELDGRMIGDKCLEEFACSKAEEASIGPRMEQVERLRVWVEPELEKIGHWMDAMGFPQAVMGNSKAGGISTASPGRAYVMAISTKAGKSLVDSMEAAYATDTGEIELPSPVFVDPVPLDGPIFPPGKLAYNSASLAHELFHAVMKGSVAGNQKTRVSNGSAKVCLKRLEWHGLPKSMGLILIPFCSAHPTTT